ncbi:MAG: matrixin family metalloprotease [Myxococcota bacterium]
MTRASLTVLISVAMLAANIATPNDASAFCRMTTDDDTQVGDAVCSGTGTPLAWDEACIPYSIDERGSIWLSQGDVEDAITASFDAWQSTSCSGEEPNVIFQMGEPSTCQESQFNDDGRPNVNTVAFLDPWERPNGDPLDPRAFAVTIVWFRNDGQILDADILINEELGPYDLCPDTGCPEGTFANPGPADLQSIVTHEVGHIIGIGHSTDPTATMFAQAPRTEVQKRTLGQDDIEAVCTIYPPGNLNASCDATPFNGLDLNCEDALPPVPQSSGGCSASSFDAAGAAPIGGALLLLLAATAMRRRSRRLDARS